MRILHLVDVRWASGLAHYALALAEGQRRAGHQVSVAAPSGAPAFERAVEWGLPTIALERPFLRLPALRRAAGGFDILNAHTGSTHVLAVLLAGPGAAVVRTRADARPPAPRPGASWIWRRTQGLIAANKSILKAFGEPPWLPKARAAIHQGLDPAGPFQPGPPAPEGAPAGLLGRLDPVKGHEDALQALAMLRSRRPGMTLAIAGPEANVQVSTLKDKARALGIAGQVAVLGPVASSADFMLGCAFGLVTSKGSEAVSRAALEWMACGKALIATRVGALPELIDDGKTGLLVPPSDPLALMSAMEHLCDEPAYAARLGAAARRRIETDLSLSRFVEATDALYKRARPAEVGA